MVDVNLKAVSFMTQQLAPYGGAPQQYRDGAIATDVRLVALSFLEVRNRPVNTPT